MALYCLVGSANKAIVATATTAISGTKDTVTAGGGVSVLQIPLAERFSAEASLKYFLLGSFSSAFLLYGIALFYGYSGSTFIADIPPTLSTGGITTLTPYLLALSFLCLGFFFKLGSVPFHYWTPDVYEGAPTGITTYMASTIKCVATLIMIRFVLQIYPQAEVSGAIWSVAVATLLVGNVIALRQFSVKRMLAYSSIAHVGYILMGVLSATPYEGNSRSVAAVIFYLLGYSITTIGAFAILSIVERNNKGNSDLDTFRTLKSNSPFMAGMFTLFMFSLAGLPPGLVGLVGKFLVFNESVRAGYVGLAIVGAIGSAISIYYYLKVVMVIYFNESEKTYSVKDSVEKSYTVSPHTLNPYGVTFTERLVILGCSLGVIFTGIFCSPILQLMSRILEG
jgi:NADH-quinone oxidoreductase subunit N